MSLLTVLTATIAVAAAVLGPLYLHAGGDSVVRRTVNSAPPDASGLTLLPIHDVVSPVATAHRALHVVESSPGSRRRFGTPVAVAIAAAAIASNGNHPVNTQLVSRPGVCGVLHFLQGGCHLGLDKVIVTSDVAHNFHLHVGSRFGVYNGGSQPLTMTVTGVYAEPSISLPIWWGDGGAYFPLEAGGAPSPGKDGLFSNSSETDSLFTAQSTVLRAPLKAVPTITEQVPVRHNAIDLADEGAVRRTLTRDSATLQSDGIKLGSQLPQILDGADHQRHQMSTIVAIAATQLVVLAIWVLASLLVRSSDARRSEARVARLRGFSPASMVWVTAAEPGLLCVIGAMLGVAVAWVAVLVARSALFSPGSSIAFDGWTFAALGLTLVVILSALGVGTLRLLRAADLNASATQRTSRTSVLSIVTDVVLVVLAIVALVALGTTGALSSSGRSDPLASIAPGLIALGAAVIAVQLILLVCRLAVRVSVDSRLVAPFLAARQTARRPAVLRQARVLVIALCLACFAASAWSVARTNRTNAARFAVGAHTVVTVDQTSASALQQAVARADPRGRWAMAAVKLDTTSSSLLAVDSSRLTSAASWPSGITAHRLRTIAHQLTPVSHPLIDLPAGRVDLSARTSATARLTGLRLAMWISSPTGGSAIVPLDELRAGTRTYVAELGGECQGGCHLVGLGVVALTGVRLPSSGTVTTTVTGLSAPGAGAALTHADLARDGWRATASGATLVGGGQLTFTANATAISQASSASASLSNPMVSVADHPGVLPAVATREQININDTGSHTIPTQGLDATDISVRPVVTATALPRIGADGLMVDLGYLSAVQTNPTSPDVTDEVWLGPRAPRDAVARLRQAGLDPSAVDRSATVLSQMNHTGPALADDFLLVATLAALLVAAASTLGALGATTRQRATELTSMHVSGVPRRTIARALALETTILLITALTGTAAGVLAALLAVPSLPELASSTLAPLRYTLPGGLITIVTVVVIAAVALAAGAISAVLLTRMTPSLLRTVPDDATG